MEYAELGEAAREQRLPAVQTEDDIRREGGDRHGDGVDVSGQRGEPADLQR